MVDSGRILIADDEQTFLRSTADLLREEGYECDCASDGMRAAEMLKEGEYDLLIADIKMPGNPDLELIQGVPQVAEGFPVILVTGYPSLSSAIKSIELPVVSYLIKPIELDKLLAQVRISIQRFRINRTLYRMKERLRDWHKYLGGIDGAVKQFPNQAAAISVDAFLALTLGNVAASLSDMKHLIKAFVGQNGERPTCNLMNCPRLSELKDAITETINVLERTKGAFRSKQLGRLRSKLERLA